MPCPAIVDLVSGGNWLFPSWTGNRVLGELRTLARATGRVRGAKLATHSLPQGAPEAILGPGVRPVASIGFSALLRSGSQGNPVHGVDFGRRFGRGPLAFRGPDSAMATCGVVMYRKPFFQASSLVSGFCSRFDRGSWLRLGHRACSLGDPFRLRTT